MAKKKQTQTAGAPPKMTARQRAAQEFSGGYEDFADVIRPEDGKNFYRVLPPKSLDPTEDSFYISRKQHFYDKKPVLCPKTDNLRAHCAICDEHVELKKVDEDAASLLRASDAYFLNVVKISKKELGKDVEILQLKKTAMKNLIEMYSDEEDGGDPWGEDCGRKGVAYDIMVSKTGKGYATRYMLTPYYKAAKIKTPESILKAISDLDSMIQFKVPSSEEVEALVGGSGGGTRVASTKKAAPKPAPEDDEEEEEELDEDDLDDDDEEDEDEDADAADEAEADEDEDEDEETDEDDDDEEADDDEDDDDSEDEDDDDDDDDDEEEDDDDDDDDDDEEEDAKPEPVKPAKKKVTKKAVTKSTPKGKTDSKALANMLKSGKRKSA